MALQEYVQGSKRAELCAVMYVHEDVRFEHRVGAIFQLVGSWPKQALNVHQAHLAN